MGVHGSGPAASMLLGSDFEPPGPCVQTRDLDEAREIIGRAYAPHEMETRGRGPDLHVRLWLTEFERMNIGYTAFGTDIHLVAPPILSHYIVCLPVTGHTRAYSGGEEAVLTTDYGAVTHPTETMTFEEWSEDCLLLGVRVDRADVEDELAAMLGHPLSERIRFDFGMDLRKGYGGGFLRAVQLLQAEAQRPDSLARTEAVATKMSELVVSGLLLAQPHNYSEELRGPAEPAPPKSIGRAIDFIETTPTEVVSAVHLARIACLSVRALSDGFNRYVGVAPMTYVREVKLARVRADLLEADPSSTTVAAVAGRWGFNHLSRFTEMYRRKYGVLPSVTLRQHHGCLRKH